MGSGGEEPQPCPGRVWLEAEKDLGRQKDRGGLSGGAPLPAPGTSGSAMLLPQPGERLELLSPSPGPQGKGLGHYQGALPRAECLLLAPWESGSALYPHRTSRAASRVLLRE